MGRSLIFTLPIQHLPDFRVKALLTIEIKGIILKFRTTIVGSFSFQTSSIFLLKANG